MIMNSYQPARLRGFGAADAAVQDWCANKFPGDPALQAKCSQNNFPLSISPPWTDVGALLRGIPKNSAIVDLINGGAGGASPGYTPPPATSSGIFGIPTTIMIAGGAVLAIGVGAMVLSRRKRPAVNGYAGRRRRRSKSRR